MRYTPERINALRATLQAPLPGHAHFLALSGYPRPDPKAIEGLRPPPRESAVLALVYPRGDVLHTLLMRRPTYAGVHSGQVSFPGGRREPHDQGTEDTALREFFEETGAASTSIELLGTLSQVYIPPSRSLVTPYVGFAPMLGEFHPDPREVDALIETPLQRLLEPDVLKRGPVSLPAPAGTREVPYFDIEGHVVWGATAMMLAELRELLLRNTET